MAGMCFKLIPGMRRWTLALAVAATVPLHAQTGGALQPPDGTMAPGSNNSVMARAMEEFKAKDYAAALKSFRLLADAGNVEAMMYIALMNAAGKVGPVNYWEALAWFRKA